MMQTFHDLVLGKRTPCLCFLLSLTLVACSNTPNKGMPVEPSHEQQAQAENEWIAPKKALPNNSISYQLYDTPARGKQTQGSYLIYLPDGYEADSSKRYPVIYWLHGGFGSQYEGLFAMQNLSQAMAEKKMPEAIIVAPHLLPMGWYVNSIDGKRPLETIMVQNLVPHIDAKYRTKNDKRYRAVEGMSMGGYGALRFGLKYPELFGVVSAYAPSILRAMSQEPSYRTLSTFGTDERDFYAQSPWYLFEQKGSQVASAKSTIRIVTAGKDPRLNETLADFVGMLKQKNIEVQTQEAPQAGHVYKQMIEELGDDNFAFWQKAFQ